GPIKSLLEDGGNTLPEWNYVGFSTYTLLIPEFLNLISRELATTIPQAHKVVGPAWNYLDAGCSLIVGLCQLIDTENHRQVTTKIKGGLNIANAAQLVALTATGFGGPGFAIAFGIAFASSLDDTIRAMRRRYDFIYWLEDSLRELDRVNQTLTQEKKKNNFV